MVIIINSILEPQTLGAKALIKSVKVIYFVLSIVGHYVLRSLIIGLNVKVVTVGWSS